MRSHVLVALGLWVATPVLAQEAAPRLAAIDSARATAAERAARSVVQIEVERADYGMQPLTTMEKRGLGVTGPIDDRYFVRPTVPSSGVVIAPNVVATYSWNLEGDGEVSVIAPDGTRYAATRLGQDENLQVSLIRVEGATLTPFEPASLPLVVGRTLMLVGRGDGNQVLVTSGIVSGLARLRGDAFTHSARTSYANVGGALVDLEGKLVGLSVRHTNRARQGQSSGVGFGARFDLIQPNLEGMVKGEVIPGKPTAFLGIGPDPRFPGPGVRIARIVADTAAKKVGLQPGDVIMIFNSVELMDFNHLVEEIVRLEVGAQIVITVKRGEQELDFQVTLGDRPKEVR